jgi:hypothetical protein
VFEITVAYYGLRYGNLKLTTDDERRVETLLMNIRQKTEKKPG